MDDYCPSRRFRGEHGLSLHIEALGARILFDTGQSDAFLENARHLALDLSAVDAVVLSHGHYDHGGGLKAFYESVEGELPPLLAGGGFDEPRFWRSDSSIKEIGLPRPFLGQGAPPVRTIAAPLEFVPGLWIMPSAQSAAGEPGADPRFRRQSGHSEVPDDFGDELSLVVIQDAQMVIVTGCAHRGILNIVRAARSTFPNHPVKAVVGGFHLVDAPDAELARVAEALAELEVQAVYCSHCTGLRGFAALSGKARGKVSWLSCGSRISL